MLGDNDQDALRGAVLPAEGIEIFFVAGLGSPEGVLRFGDTVIVGIRSEDGHVVGVCGIAAYIENRKYRSVRCICCIHRMPDSGKCEY